LKDNNPLMDYLPEWTLERLTAWMTEHGLPKYRAGQIRRWIFQRRADTFEKMSDLPKKLRAELEVAFRLRCAKAAAHPVSDDGTEKLLLEFNDAQQIETVLLRDDRGHRTACLSTQVGCAMGCVFCASGLGGIVRNLTSGEIIEQMLQVQALLPEDERLSHLVIMGVGEPLANLKGLLPALEKATDPDAFGISARRITISTVGLPKGLRRLAEANAPYHLAVSLHAPNDSLRDELVPANRGVGVLSILRAADEYFDQTGRRITYEYVLLNGLNDREEHARELAALLKGRPAMINLIPYNPVRELPYRTPNPVDVKRFGDILTKAGLNVQTRWLKGDGIDAACGQLRRSKGEGETAPG
jgi:23S rRNA (adenine2503-C2)-methyltransferase